MDSLTCCSPQHTLSYELRNLINQRNILSVKSKAKVLHDLDKQIKENETRSYLDLRSKIIDEIFTSELSYLNQLEIIIKYFKEPLESSNLMPLSTRRCLFGSIESLYRVNGELVNQLKIQEDNVGAAFLYLAPFLKVYSMYAYGYKNAQPSMQVLSNSNTKLSKWLKRQETRPEVCCKLSALLIAPIQRLPRYRLLLRQLLNWTSVTHPHYSILVDAVKEVEKTNLHINDVLFKQETYARLLTLQQCLIKKKPLIVTANRKLVNEGILMKMSANGQKAQARYLILLTDILLYCKMLYKDITRQPIEPGSLQCCCVLPISKISVESVLGETIFKLTCRSETYIFFSDNKDEVLEWAGKLRNTILQYKENKKTLKKKNSSTCTTRKRKCLKGHSSTEEEDSPMKKSKLEYQTVLEGNGKTSYIDTMTSMFHAVSKLVHGYLSSGTSQ